LFKALYTVLLAMLIYVPGICQTTLPAVIDTDTVLTMEGSPYYVQQNLSINSGITLKINEGTPMEFVPFMMMVKLTPEVRSICFLPLYPTPSREICWR